MNTTTKLKFSKKATPTRVGALGLICAVLVTACWATVAQAKAPAFKGSVSIAMFQNFSGTGASFAPETEAACISAANLANQAGGVDRHQVKCVAADSGVDPADAVTEANRMAATIPNLEAIVGATSDIYEATASIFQRDKIPVLTNAGLAIYDRTTNPYFWRLVPTDRELGAALALYATQHDGPKVALLFTSDPGSQSDLPSTVLTLHHLHADITVNQTIAADSVSYQSEVEALLATHPSSIIMEMQDQQTAATYMGELKQLNGGKLIPMVTVTFALSQPYIQAVAQAVGGTTVLANSCVGMAFPYTINSGPAYESYSASLLSPGSSAVPTPIAWAYNPAAEGQFEGTALFLIAMAEAHSVVPKVWNPYVAKVADGTKGAVTVNTITRALQEIKTGHKVHFVGVMGPVRFNKWHSALSTGFGAYHCALGARPVSLVHYSSAQLEARLK